MSQTAMTQEKRGWDTRAWLVGILGGVIGGSIPAAVYHPAVAGPINAALRSASGAGWVNVGAGVLSCLVLPGVLSGMARRRTFLWGALPLVLWLVTIDVAQWIVSGPQSVVRDFWKPVLIIGGCLLVSSGPVSLFRYRLAYIQRRREAALAFLAAQREAAFVPQRGVWPPPPDYRK